MRVRARVRVSEGEVREAAELREKSENEWEKWFLGLGLWYIYIYIEVGFFVILHLG